MFAPLSDDELSLMRQAQEATMTQAVVAERQEEYGAGDGQGATLADWHPVFEGVCRVLPRRGVPPRQVVQADQSIALADVTILLPVGSDIRPGDRLTVETAGGVYRVIGTDAGKADAAELTAFCANAA